MMLKAKKINATVEKIFESWELGDIMINGDDSIKSAIREAYVEGYEKGFKKCEKAINKAKKPYDLSDDEFDD